MIVQGTPVTTKAGDIPVEQLKVGDSVLTYESGFQPIKWIGTTTIVLQGFDDDLAPIRLEQDAMGRGQPGQAILVSPAHRVFWSGSTAQALFGKKRVLVPAKYMINGTTVQRDISRGRITYRHILFDGHKLLFSSGLKSESYFPSIHDATASAMETRQELLRLFPELKDVGRNYARKTAPPALRAYEYRPGTPKMADRCS
ncbi:MAG: Hint domain-containing protein [Pseudomonadota bacterium]